MRTIEKVTNIVTNEILLSDIFFEQPEETLINIRSDLAKCSIISNRHKTGYTCFQCNQPVKMRGTPKGIVSMHFAHLNGSGDCPWKTDLPYTHKQIDRMKFNGVKESFEHLETKNFIANMLRNDNDFKDTKVEETYRGKGLSKKWKKPDISTKFKETPIVFEIQLATTYLEVINERNLFYQSNNTFIVWVFREFNFHLLTTKDIVIPNNNHAFLLSDEAKIESKKQGTLILECIYKAPHLNNNEIEEEWSKKLVPIEALTFDYDKYSVYLINPEKEYKKLKEEKERIEQEELTSLKTYFEKQWISNSLSYTECLELQNDLASYGIECELTSESLRRTLNTVFSLKHNKIINYNFSNLISLINNFIEHSAEYIGVVLSAIYVYDRSTLLINLDKNHSMQKKLIQFKSKRPTQNKQNNYLFNFIFPELKEIDTLTKNNILRVLIGK